MRIVLVIIIGSLLAAARSGPAQTNAPAPAPSLPAALQPRVSVPPVAPAAAVAAPAAAGKSAGMINFQGAPLPAVLEYYARLTKRSIIQAPQLAGTIFFTSQTELTVEEAIQALDTVLALNQVGVVPMGEKFLKVVQIPAAKQEGIAVNVGLGEGKAWPAADTLVTQILPLKYADAQEVLAALQPYMHAYGQMMALAKSNSILITETGGNLNQMLEIVKYIDQPMLVRMETRIYVLKHAKAPDVMQRLQQFIQESQSGSRSGGAAPAAPQPVAMPQPLAPRPAIGARPAVSVTAGTPGEDSLIEGKVIMTADERTNKLFILSRLSNFDFFEKIIKELDMKVEPDIQTKVVELQYAQAEEAASLLMSLLTGGSGGTTVRRSTSSSSGSRSGSSGSSRTGMTVPPPPMGMGLGLTGGALGGTTGGGAAALEAAGFLQYAEGVRVLPDPRTNSLLVMATKEDMARLEKLIRDIDTAVAQVMIEVVIATVQLDHDLEIGVNWLNRALNKDGKFQMAGGSLPSTDSGGNALPLPQNALGALAGATPQGAALSGALTYFGTLKGMNMDIALRLLASVGKTKVLSRPIIQTLHNQEASIIDGSSVPVPSTTMSSYGGGYYGGSNSLGLQAAIEYKDVAIEMKVTPRINPEGYVTMEIDQKINDLAGYISVGGIQAPQITKREAKAFVTAKDDSTIVLGGVIREENDIVENKVPFFGDIPFFGQAFKSKQTKKQRKELILFIRPTVLRSSTEAVAEAQRRTRQLKSASEMELEQHFGDTTGTNAPPPVVPVPRVPPDPARSDGNRPAATNAPPAAATEPGRSAADGERAAAKARALRGLAPGED